MPITKSKSNAHVAPHSPPPTTRKMPPARKLPMMALPTPPRTRPSRKRKRGSQSDSDDELPPQDSSDLESEQKTATGHRRKMLKLDAIAAELSGQAAEEEAFWTGEPSTAIPTRSAVAQKGSTAKAKKVTIARGRSLSRSPTRSPSSSPPAHLLRRTNTGLMSPPPSRRQPRTSATLAAPVTPPRKTPARKAKTKDGKDPVSKKLFPERDSPNNPFLLGNGDNSPDTLPPGSVSPGPRTPEPYVEKPTITYVFRGVKAIVDNPLYDPSHKGRVPSPAPDSPSQLPVDHPDYSPTPYCAPKLLFPEARHHDHARVRKRRVPAGGDSSPTIAGDVPSSSTAVNEDSLELPKTPTKKRVHRSKTPPRRVHSEWDSSDDEDHGRGRRRRQQNEDSVLGVRPKVPQMPGLRAALDDQEALVEDSAEEEADLAKLGERPKKPLSANSSRLSKIAPLLVGTDVPGRR